MKNTWPIIEKRSSGEDSDFYVGLLYVQSHEIINNSHYHRVRWIAYSVLIA